MLRVAVSGYYGFNNTGDEAILLALTTTLKTLSQGVEITAFSHSPRETRQSYGIKAVNRWNPLAVLWTLARSDLLISGGGGLLQDVTRGRSIYYYLAVVLLAKLMGKTVVYYAQGVGPIRSPFRRWLTGKISNKADLITVRDQASKEDFLSMGVKRPPVVVTADPVLGMSPQQISLEHGQALMERLRAEQGGVPPEAQPAAPEEDPREQGLAEREQGKNPGRRTLGIVIRDWKNIQHFKGVVASVADRMVREGWEVFLVPFQYPADLAACRDVAGMMREEHYLVNERLPVETLFSLMGSLDLILGMRLHSLVMASVMRTPCVGLSYDPKVDRFLEMTGQPVAGSVSDLDGARLHRELLEAWEGRQETAARLEQVLLNLRQQAWETASLSLSVFYARYPHRRGETGRVPVVKRKNTAR